MLFFKNTSNTSVPHVIDEFKDGDEELFDFRALLGVTARKEAKGPWAAFAIFRTWI
jgi:hypothetical protein